MRQILMLSWQCFVRTMLFRGLRTAVHEHKRLFSHKTVRRGRSTIKRKDVQGLVGDVRCNAHEKRPRQCNKPHVRRDIRNDQSSSTFPAVHEDGNPVAVLGNTDLCRWSDTVVSSHLLQSQLAADQSVLSGFPAVPTGWGFHHWFTNVREARIIIIIIVLTADFEPCLPNVVSSP
jgi:hypothetical protein